jgi:hypothetical protein
MQSIVLPPTARRALAALGVFWLAMLNWGHPVLRLSTSYANLLVIWLLLILPLGVAIAALVTQRGRVRWLLLTLAIPAVLVSVIPFLGASLELLTTGFGEPDSGFDPVQRTALPHGGELVVYLTDCGATCSVGAVVRHERTLVPGVLLLVRNVYSTSRYRAEDVRVELVGEYRARVDFDVVRLRRWVYL